MSQELSFFLVVFTSFFTVINPLGVLPIFLTMTDGLDNVHRRNTAQKAMLVSFITLVLFSLSGQVLFDFFGISVHSFRIVGGIIFFMVGQDMLQARLQRTKVPSKQVKEYVGDISITPLAIPMITGPGAITNAIVLKEQASGAIQVGAFYAGIFAVCLITLLLLVSANQILKVLGETGAKILMRIMGLIVMVIAVEFFLSGLRPIIKETLIYLQS
ncbi:NAAT family transporter [Cryomorphaceae bacterium]|nr:NAAT family transporter [Cryomorphaceae bacterium]